MRTKQAVLDELESIRLRLSQLDLEVKELGSTAMLPTQTLASVSRATRRELWRVRDKADYILPMIIEGYVAKDNEEVDRDEHGSHTQDIIYLGCPHLKVQAPNKDNIMYDESNDVTKALEAHKRQYLRVTIEAVGIEERENCASCNVRFQCLTSV